MAQRELICRVDVVNVKYSNVALASVSIRNTGRHTVQAAAKNSHIFCAITELSRVNNYFVVLTKIYVFANLGVQCRLCE